MLLSSREADFAPLAPNSVLHYRVYVVGSDNRIRRGFSIEAPSDDEALLAAEAHRGVHGLEVWQGARIVGRMPAAASRQAHEPPW